MNRRASSQNAKQISNARIFVLPGDGIGPEVVAEALKALEAVERKFGHKFEKVFGFIGGASIDQCGEPLADATLNHAIGADAVLLGAVGGPKWDDLSTARRPEFGLLSLRKNLKLCINIRPVHVYDALLKCSRLKPEFIQGVDFIIVRELAGGLYFGKPKQRLENARGQRALDTTTYTEKQIAQVVKVAYEIALTTKRQTLHSVDKMNVLETSRLWRDVVTDLANDYHEVSVNHLFVDTAALRLITNPRDFDVIVTENMFGDILSDEAAALTGSLGLMPSASLASSPFANRARNRSGVYEPAHGAAPSIAGWNTANPSAAILSVAMLLEYSFKLKREADAVKKAFESVIEDGYVTEDIKQDDKTIVTTSQMGSMVAERIGE